VYCLKGVDVRVAPHGLPEAVAIGVIAVLQVWKNKFAVKYRRGYCAVYAAGSGDLKVKNAPNGTPYHLGILSRKLQVEGRKLA
jgi:hypothetical protein